MARASGPGGSPPPVVHERLCGLLYFPRRMPAESLFERLGSSLEALLFGERAPVYRLFVRATFVVAVGLAGAYVAVRAGVVPLGPGAENVLGVATAVTATVLVLSGIVEFVVLGRVYQRGTSEVARAAADLEEAAEQLEETATDLETTAEEVEDAAETVDEAAADIEETGEHPDEAAAVRDKTSEVKETADAVLEEAEVAKRTATAVEVTAEEKRERLPDQADGETEGDADGVDAEESSADERSEETEDRA